MTPGFLSGLMPFKAACRNPSLSRCRYSISTTTNGGTHGGGVAGNSLIVSQVQKTSRIP